MPKVADAGEDHRDVFLVRRRDHLLVPDRAARLNHGGRPGLGENLESIPKREEGIGGGHRSLQRAGRLESGDPSDEVGRALLDAKAFLEAEVDMLQTLAAWTITVNPGTPEAEVLAKRNIRAPFIPHAPLRSPKKDIRTGVIENGECFILLKEMHGIKARLIAEIIPVWVEPWYARRRIVGHRIVWRLEFVPAEFIKKLTTCKGRGKLVHDVHQEAVLEPKLLNFWRFYGKGHGKGYGKDH